ncbi:MAG: bifunctional glutamate N-acetyltransferase/amino-acid acetyltransferase ArgJ [Devosia sp.]
MTVDPSPFAPTSHEEPPAVAGVSLATAMAGIKTPGKRDVLLMAFDEGTTVAGVFTRSKCASAPVEWCREHIGAGTVRGILVNSGNANAFTGVRGRTAAEQSAGMAGRALGVSPHSILLASTGVIGEPLSADKFAAVMDDLAANLSPSGWVDAARAIMTTDTFPKVATRTVEVGGRTITLNGMSKGAGMIAPDMATMLAFVATDAAVPAPFLQELLSDGVTRSFNKITVDSDTSTSDTLLLAATGASGVEVAAGSEAAEAFQVALDGLLRELAHLVVKDGEGCTKFVAVTVAGAMSDASAGTIARAIADSPLVKTAVAGEDANWGRVVMAVGKAGEPADRDALSIWFGDVRVATGGERDPDYSEEAAAAVMRQAEIEIRVELGLGGGQDTIWTCDLTKAYVAINGDYRT